MNIYASEGMCLEVFENHEDKVFGYMNELRNHYPFMGKNAYNGWFK